MKIRALLVVSLLLLQSMAFGAGFALFEHSGRATGIGGAFAATADDPSALFFNPAGIAFQKASVLLETTVIAPYATFEGDGPYPGDGVREDMLSQHFFPSDVALVLPLSDRFTLAGGMFNPFGLGTAWDHAETYTGRYVSTKADIRGFNLAAALSWKPADGVAFALGFHYLAANLDLEKYVGAVNPYTLSVANVGFVRMDAEREGDLGWDLGVMIKAGDRTTLGLTYHSETTIDFEGTAKFRQIATGYADFDYLVGLSFPAGDHAVTTTVHFPAMAFAGVNVQLTDRWSAEFNIGWTGWDVYESLALTFPDNPELDTVRNSQWEDTYTYRLGAEYAYSGATVFRLGLVYDETPQPVWDAGPLLPDADRTGYCVGWGYTYRHMSFDAGYMYLQMKDRSTGGQSQDGYNGTYESYVHLLSVGLVYHL
jgi:long-chain fatty acid transport protein